MANRTAKIAALALVLACTGTTAAHAKPVDTAPATSGNYIVTLKDGASPKGLAKSLSVSPKHTYTKVLNGFSAHLTAGQVRALAHNSAVKSIEADQVASIDPVSAMASTKTTTSAFGGLTPLMSTQSLPRTNAQWNLDRVDQTTTKYDYKYTYSSTGMGVSVYVVDTGIDVNHPDFAGRASTVFDAIDGTGTDCNGHGTHVAGTAGGGRYGVAKNVTLKSVRVLGCDGKGTYSGIIAGLDYIAANNTGPAVVNMSLGGDYSPELNAAVQRVIDSGVFVAVAAGNANVDASTVSPASTPDAMTVAASDSTDTKASFSNYGSAVDIYAPGVGVQSDWPNSQIASLDGTSQASPAVAGAAALYLSRNTSSTPAQTTSWLKSNATSVTIKSNVAGTTNLLLNKRSL